MMALKGALVMECNFFDLYVAVCITPAQQVTMVGCQRNIQSGSKKIILRASILVFAVLTLICLTKPTTSLPLEGAFGENENRFRCK